MSTTPLRRSIALRVSHAVDRLDYADAVLSPDVELAAALGRVAAALVEPAVRAQRLIELAALAEYQAGITMAAAGIPPLSHTDLVFSENHARALYLLADRKGATDEQLFRYWQPRTARKVDPWPFISEAGLRSRRAELTRWGLVEPAPGTGTTRAGRRAQRWQAADPHGRPSGSVPVPPASRDARRLLAEVLPYEPDADMTHRAVLLVASVEVTR